MQGVYEVRLPDGSLWMTVCYRMMADDIAARVGGTVVTIVPDGVEDEENCEIDPDDEFEFDQLEEDDAIYMREIARQLAKL